MQSLTGGVALGLAMMVEVLMIAVGVHKLRAKGHFAAAEFLI